MKLISIGFGSTVCAERILAVIAPESAPIKRLIQEARERGMLIDASFGRKTMTLYQQTTKNQIMSLPISSSSSFTRALINAGEIRNRGIELAVTGVPLKIKSFQWETTFTYATNENKVLLLY